MSVIAPARPRHRLSGQLRRDVAQVGRVLRRPLSVRRALIVGASVGLLADLCLLIGGIR